MKKKKIEQLKNFFTENDFNVFLTKQDGVQCAEIEKWTDGGVDMIFFLNPFSAESFESQVSDFNIDEEIDLHRQDNTYKNNFTISESVTDFTNFHNHLKDIASKLQLQTA